MAGRSTLPIQPDDRSHLIDRVLRVLLGAVEDDLRAAARSKGYADLEEVAMAVLEDDGSVSFISAER